MKKILLAAALSVLAFIGTLVGFYAAMPSISPDRVEEAERYIDSLTQIAYLDSLRLDSLSHVPSCAPVATPSTDLAADEVALLQDSLNQLTTSLGLSQREQNRLQVQVDLLKQNVKRLQEQANEAESLGGTLSKLEDKELRAILQQVDGEVLEMIYRTASSRNRVRLLQAMPSEQAARFVGNLVRPGQQAAPPPPQEPAETAAS